MSCWGLGQAGVSWQNCKVKVKSYNRIDSDWESVLLAEVQHHKVLQRKRTVKPTTEGASHPTSPI